MKRTLLVLILSLSLLLVALAQQSQHSEIKIDPKTFDPFVGVYRPSDDLDFTLSVFREGDRFYIQGMGQPKIEIFPEAENQFFMKVLDVEIRFVRDVQGSVTGLVSKQNGEESDAPKISSVAKDEFVAFDRREQMIPMRDGIRLHTVIFTPKDQKERLPLIFNRTPYGIGEVTSDRINQRYFHLVKDGYIFVFQDIRGRYGSKGRFMLSRPPREKKDGIDESTDTYDTIDWLIKNVPNNNGRAGILGGSYDGWLAAVATMDAHPALKASSPQAPMTDIYIGDDFFHNGAFRQSYGYEYVKMMESSNEVSEVVIENDAYDWYLGLGSLSKITAESRGRWPTWNAFVAHPNYDSYWKSRAAQRYLKPTTVATLVVGGWWDQEDFFGPLATYAALEKFDRQNRNFIVLGPWNHGGWVGSGRDLGDVNFGSSTGLYYRSQVEAPWFASYLKDNRNFSQPEALTFRTGANEWTRTDRWPPIDATARDLFLRSGKKLSFEQPAGNAETEFESYVSDPANPVPYRKRPIQATYGQGSTWYTWLVQSQRFLQDRTDVISWQTDILGQDLTISGNIVAHLFASTSGTDSDWIVKLIDVYPDEYPQDQKMAGYQLMVANEILRGRFRRNFEKPSPIAPNSVEEYTIDMRANNYTFKKGHRVMVQVQSTWFPLYDRNPQRFVDNIFKASPSDYHSATQRVYQSARYPSRVTLPVVSW